MSEILTNDPLSRMHLWLAKIRSSGSGGPGLRIEHFTRDFLPLSSGVAAHFSQYDDSGEPDWLCLDDACAELARRDHAVLRMLGFHEDEDVPMPAFIPALFRGGRIIMERPISEESSNPVENSFRVALVPSGIFQPPGFHLAVDPLKFTRTCLVSVIGDTFLEWMHNRDEAHVERIDP